MIRLVLVVPGDLDTVTGGNVYDRALVDALRTLGVAVAQRRVPGAWPVGSPADRARLAAALRGPDPVLVDGLLAAGAPDTVAAAAARGPVHVLVHLPLALETGLAPARGRELDALERAALRGATGVVATSRWAADHLRTRHGLGAVAVAEPGARAAPPARGSAPPRLLQLAAVIPRKDQLGVVEALAGVDDLEWSAHLVGPTDRAPGYGATVRAAIAEHGLDDRVRLTGVLSGPALTREWDATDLLLLPSRAETWGMTVTEALARGVPAVVGAGTGAQEALGSATDGGLPGAVVPPGDPEALGAALRTLLTDPAALAAARGSARSRRATLVGWKTTARRVLAALAGG